jgi:2',3'-cyclic-nucleotide 2'-phosphodiesterase (5'-nucleotidase family)
VKRLAVLIPFFLFLIACSHRQLSSYVSANIEVDSTISGSGLDSLIAPYRAELNATMMAVIGYSDSNLVSYAPESPLSNFVADVVFKRALSFAAVNDMDCTELNSMCMLNFGGIRSVINKGEITTSTIFELMPFDNTIVIIRLAPPEVIALLNTLYDTKGQPVANVDIELSAAGHKLRIGKTIHYDFTDDLYVITSDYLANGGDKMSFFKSHVNRWDTGLLVREVLIEYITSVKNISYTPVEGRIIME